MKRRRGLSLLQKRNVKGFMFILPWLISGEECGTVLRAKGIVAGADGVWYHFDFVPEEYEVRTGSADVTGRMCVIGAKLAEDKIKALFGV